MITPKDLVERWSVRTNTIKRGGVFLAFGGTLLAEDGVIEMPTERRTLELAGGAEGLHSCWYLDHSDFGFKHVKWLQTDMTPCI